MDRENEFNKSSFIENTQYFIETISDDRKASYLSETEHVNIQMQLWQLMQRQTERYTMGDSSSIPIDVANELKKSIYFSLGAYFKIKLKDEDKLKSLKNMKLLDIFLEGQKEIFREVEKGRKLLIKAKETSCKLCNISYDDTIKALDGFFISYDVYLMAHNITCMIDYQLSKSVPELYGIEYINEYLKRLIIENEFCLKFSTKNIVEVLQAGCSDYKEDLINIFEPVFNNAIGLELLNKDIFRLDITKEDRENLYKILENKDIARDRLYAACEKLCERLGIANSYEIEYLNYATKELISRVSLLGKESYENIFVSLYNRGFYN